VKISLSVQALPRDLSRHQALGGVGAVRPRRGRVIAIGVAPDLPATGAPVDTRDRDVA
jgi:hypothetical protein